MAGQRVANAVMFEQACQVPEGEVVRFAQAIIRQASITGEEGELGRFLARALEGLSLQTELLEVAPGRHNVQAVLPGDDPAVTLLFHSHMDTVPFGAMADPLSAEIADDQIWGRGSVDQKGGLAAAVMALATIARSGVRLRRSLGLALVIDEESEHRGSMALVEQALRSARPS
jgi:succinyl-diaminopimelate desuccinylase